MESHVDDLSSSTEDGWPVQHLISEEDLIDTLFHTCDSENTGKVQVSKMIEYLKFSICGIKQGEPDLDQLQSLLDPEGVNCGVGIEEYRECITKWVKNLRNKNNSLEDTESDSLENIGKHKSQADSLNNNNNSYGSLELSGVGEKLSSKSEHDVCELLHEIADMKFHNRKLTEENAKLQQLLVAQDDHIAGMVAETERFQKKIKELKELSELRQEVQVENEELKVKICKLQENNKELQNTLNHLEKEKVVLESNCADMESEFQKSTMEVNKIQKENQELHDTVMEQKKLLAQSEEDLSAKDQVMAEKLTELNELQQKLEEVVSLNERLKEEKKDVEMLLNHSQYELFSLQELKTDPPLTDSSFSLERTNNSEMVMASSRFVFGTPFSQRDSLCMELKDIDSHMNHGIHPGLQRGESIVRQHNNLVATVWQNKKQLEINKHLPSPLCEKRPDDYNRFRENYSMVLPPYTSVWELDPSTTNSFTEDLSTEVPVLRHSKSVAVRALEGESRKKAKYIHEVESEWESMQAESEELRRQNFNQAEKCRSSEAQTKELEEDFGQTKTKVVSEKYSYQELESIQIKVDPGKGSKEKESAINTKLVHETDLRDLWRLVQKDIEYECIEDQSNSSPLSGSSEHLKEQIAQEIASLKSRLKKRQAALGVLKGRPTFLPIKVHQSYEFGQHREDTTENSPLIEALAIDDAQRDCCSIDGSIQDKSKKSCKASCLRDSSLGIRSVPLRRRNRITYFKSQMAKAHFNLNFDASGSSTNGAIDWDRLGQRLNFGKFYKHDIISDQYQNCENESPTSQSNESNTTDHDTSLIPGHMESGDMDVPTEIENGNESCGIEGGRLRRRSYTAAIENETRSVEEVHIARSRSFSFQSAIQGGKINPTGTHSESSGSSGGNAGNSFTSENHPSLPTNITETSWSGPRFSSTPLPQHKSSGKFVYFYPQTFDHSSPEKYSSDPIPPKSSIRNSLHNTSQGKEDIYSSNGSKNVQDKKRDNNSSVHIDVRNASSPSCVGSGDGFPQKEMTRQTSVSFKDLPKEGVEEQQDCGLNQGKCEKGTKSEVEKCNKENKEVSSSATNNKQTEGEQKTRMDTASPIEQKGVLKIGREVVNGEKRPSKQMQPTSSVILMQKTENMNDFDMIEKTTKTVKIISNLSRLRENNLARRREHRKQMKMPQLSELAEAENANMEENGDINHEMPIITIKSDIVEPPSPTDESVTPSIPKEFLEKLGLLPDSPSKVSLDQLSDQEIESKFTSLALAFKTDKKTLEKRHEIQERTRDLAEENVDKELQGIREKLDTLNHLCTDPQVRKELSKIRQHLDTLEQAAARVSSRAEVYGAVQQEKRFSFAVDIMVTHVENLRRVHEREHTELEEARKLLQDSRSLGSTVLDHAGGEGMFSRRSSSVCLNNLPTRGGRRRVSEVALPKVLGGSGSPSLLQPSYSMDTFYYSDNKPRFELQQSDSQEEEGNLTLLSERTSAMKDPRTKFQQVVASASMKSAVANTLRRASLDHQSSASAPNSTNISREHSHDRSQDDTSKKDLKNKVAKEEEAFQKGYEQGLRANLGKDLTDLREQQNHINHNLGEVMDTLDNQLTGDQKTLKELLIERVKSRIPKVDLSWKKVRLTLAGFLFVVAIIVVLISMLPISSASMQYRHMDKPPH